MWVKQRSVLPYPIDHDEHIIFNEDVYIRKFTVPTIEKHTRMEGTKRWKDIQKEIEP